MTLESHAMRLPLLIMYSVYQITTINGLAIQKQQKITYIISVELSRLSLSQRYLCGRKAKEMHLAGFLS